MIVGKTTPDVVLEFTELEEAMGWIMKCILKKKDFTYKHSLDEKKTYIFVLEEDWNNNLSGDFNG